MRCWRWRAVAACNEQIPNTPTSWVSPPGPAAQTELRRNRACPFPSAGTCVYYRQPTAAAGFSTESLRASRQRGRPPASAVPPPRPERKVGARAIHAGPITPTTNRARTAQPRRHRPPHMPMCYMHATMHHAEHHAHLIYMRCEREGPCSVWPTRHDFGRVPVRVSATPCRDSVLGFMDVTSSHIPPRLPS